MATVTLGGRTFEVRPLKIKHLRKIYANLDAGLSAFDMGLHILALGLVSDPPVTMEWLDDLPAGEQGALVKAAELVRRESGIQLASGPGSGEAPGPVTTSAQSSG